VIDGMMRKEEKTRQRRGKEGVYTLYLPLTTPQVVGIKEGTSVEASNSGGVYSTGAATPENWV
jgi:hypothetical protein